MGCTHYPIIAPTVAGVMGRGVTLIDSGREAALALAQALKERDLLCEEGHRRQASYFVTDTPEKLPQRGGACFWVHSVGRAHPAHRYRKLSRRNARKKGTGMLKDDYDINIIGRQAWEEDQGEITLNTTGAYTYRGGARFIAYKEYDTEDPKVSYTSVLKVEPGKVTMMRSGSSTRLILEKGRRHLCLYDTGYGTLTLGVFTSELSTSLGEAGGPD